MFFVIQRNLTMAKIKKYNELDIFLNKAMWSYKNYQDYEKITKDIISELVDEFKISKIDFVLLNISEDKKNLLIDKKKLLLLYLMKEMSILNK